MSKTIDEKVVEMRFDNKQFESNVATSMSTLEKLKKSLKLDGVSKGLEKINSAAKNNNLEALGESANTVGLRFNAMYTMADQALRNITTRVQHTAESMVKALTIDPIMSGFKEYETQINAVQTIMANTSSKGTTLDQVNAALDELNKYADLTIYNFTEMTRNIGTFTAAGIDLDTSVSAIQGIANLAAVSGSTSQQASTAMYQLSQALASGTVKLMDWNSVVNAGMGGQVFQDALKETARVHGVAIDEMIEKQGSFRETLSEGWITSEILTETLKKFTMAAEEGSEQWEKYKKSLMDTGYTEAQAESILKMANTATDAATKVKTFTQLWDTLKEAAQSGWTQTWEYIIGDFEEAKAFLTELHGFFSGIIEASATRRNNLIGEVFSSNWEKLIGKINEAGVETSQFEESIRKVVGDNKLDSLIKKYGSIQKAAEEGAISSNVLKQALDGIGSTEAGTKISDFVDGLKEIKRTLQRGHVGEDVKNLQTALKELGYDLGKPGIDGIIGPITENAIKAFQEANGLIANGIVGPETLDALNKAGTKVEEIDGGINNLRDSCDSLVDVITKTNGRELLLESLMNIIKTIHRPLSAVSEAFRDTFSISPDNLYNALEALNKFTSKFVMKGVLDATTWDDLLNSVKDLGIEIPDFERKLTEALKSNSVNVDSLIEKYGSLGEAFSNGAISLDVVKDVLLSFDGITESMLLGGESADKVRRTFEGLFAILDIIGSVVGGGLKTAFNVLTAVLDQFGMSVLDVAANMGDALVAFRDWIFEENLIARSFDWLISKIPVLINMFKAWFAVFKQTPAVQKLVDAIEAIQEAFNDLVNGDINISEFATSLGENLAKALKSLPDIARQVGKDFIAGFQNGISDSVSGVIDSIISFCQNFVAAFAAALGVASPSWKAYEIVVDFFKGAINAIKDMAEKVVPILKKVGEKIVNIFKSFWDYITDESGNVEWDKIIAGGIIVSTIWVLKQLATAFKGIADALGGIQGLLANAGKVLKSFSNVLNSISWDIKAKALLKMAIAIAVLVAAIWILTQIDVDDIDKLWNAVGVIVVLAGVLIGLSIAMSKLSSASVAFDAESKKVNIEGVQNSLLKIGIAILLVAAAVKMISGLKPEEAKQGFIGLAGIMGGMVVFLSAMGKLSDREGIKNIDRIGSMMLKLSFAMILMATVCKLIGKLSAEEMLKGAAFAAAFAVFVNSITKVAKSSGNNVAKVGSMVIGIAVAMTLMVGVCKLAGQLSAEEMLKGAAFATAFVFFVRELITATKIGKKQQIAKLSGLLLSVSFSLAMLAGVCKLVGLLSVDEMIKGAAFVTGFVFLLKKLVSILKIGEGKQIAKVSATILAMSVAIGILAGVSILLGIIDIASLAKGITAVTILSGMMTLMVKSLKGAQNVKGVIMMMAVAIAIMAASVVALSFIDIKDLAASAGALALLMGVFALMIRSLKSISGTAISLKPLIALGAVVLILTGVIVALSYVVTDAKKVLAGAGSIAGLLLVMAGVLAILGAISLETGPAMIGILALAALGLVLRELVWVLASMSDIDNALSNVGALSALFVALVGMLGVIAIVGSLIIGAGGMGLVAIIAGLGTLALTALAIKGGVALFKSIAEDLTAAMEELARASEKASGIDISAFDGIPELLSIISLIGTTSLTTGIKDFFTLGGTTMDKFQRDGVAFFKAMGEIGKAASEVKIGSDAKANIEDILGVAEGLAEFQQSLTGMGGFIGWLHGVQGLDTFGENAKKFFEGMSSGMSSVGEVKFNKVGITYVISTAKMIGEIQNSLSGVEGFIGWLHGVQGLDTFGENAKKFFEAMASAMSSEILGNTTYNKEGIAYVIDTAKELSTLQNSLKGVEGFADWLNRMYGDGNLANFGENAKAFFTGMSTAMSSIGETKFNKVGITYVISTAQKLAELQNSIQGVEGFIDWLDSMSSNLGTFGTNCATFFTSMSTAMSSVGEVTYNTESLDSILAVATKLAEFQEDKLKGVEGFMDWLDKTSNNIGTFGINASTFVKGMSTVMSSLGEGEYNSEKLGSIIDFAGKLNDLQQALPEDTLFDGKMDLTKFSKYIKKFAEAIGEFGSQTGEINLGQMNSAITAAYRLKYLINALTDLDDSGVKIFAGGFASKGAAVKIAETMANFGTTVGEISTGKMSTAVSSATRLKDLINGLAGIDTSGIDKFKVDVGSIGQSLATYSSNVSGFNGSQVAASIVSANRLKNFISSLSGLDTGGVGKFKSAVDELATVNVGTVVEAFSGASESMTTIGMNLITALSNGMILGSATIKSTTALVVSAMSNSIKSKSSSLTTVGKTFARNLASGISNNKSVVSNAAGSSASAGVSAIRGYYRSFFQAGDYLVSGFAQGIKLKIWIAEQATRDMAQKAKQAALNALLINSPSKVFRNIGMGVPEGFALGIGMLDGEVTGAVKGMASSAINTTRTAMSKVLDAINTDMDAQPTIRPVVDLSDVQTGANAINGLFNTAQSVGVQANLNAIGYSMNAMRQNGKNYDVISAINKLNDKLDGVGNTYNTINGVTYDDGSNVTDAIETLVRYAKIGGRV